MTNYVIPNAAAEQSVQNGSPSDNYILEGTSTIVGAGAGTFFGSNTPGATSTMFLTGVSAQPGGYVGDVGVLGASHATVVMGGISPTVYGGSGSADVFVQSANATIVTGSGNLQIVGDASMAGVFFGGGIRSVVHDTTGTTVTTGFGAADRFWAAGTVSAA